MLLVMHYLHSSLYTFPKNLSEVFNETTYSNKTKFQQIKLFFVIYILFTPLHHIYQQFLWYFVIASDPLNENYL